MYKEGKEVFSKLDFRSKLHRWPFLSIFLAFHGRPCSLTFSRVSAKVPDGGGERERENKSRGKMKEERGREKREKKEQKKPCVSREREKERLRFAGWENLRGAWRPSTRIWRVALVHRAGGTSNHRNLHHLLHSPSPSPPCFRARHPPPNRDSARRRPVSRYRSSRRRYPRNPHRSPASRRPRTTQPEMPHVSARPPLILLIYAREYCGRCESTWTIITSS